MFATITHVLRIFASKSVGNLRVQDMEMVPKTFAKVESREVLLTHLMRWVDRESTWLVSVDCNTRGGGKSMSYIGPLHKFLLWK